MAQAIVTDIDMAGFKTPKRPRVEGESKGKRPKKPKTEVSTKKPVAESEIITETPKAPKDFDGSFTCENVSLNFGDGRRSVVLRKGEQSPLYLNRGHLSKLMDYTLEISSALQDKSPMELDLGGIVMRVVKYETGVFVRMEKPSLVKRNGEPFGVSLKAKETIFLLENVEDFLCHMESSTSTSERPPAKDLYERALISYGDITVGKMNLVHQRKCEGCRLDLPSQRDHPCMMSAIDDVLAEQYVNEAIDSVELGEFEARFTSTTLVSTKLLYRLCRTKLRSRLEEIVLTPYRLQSCIDDLKTMG